MLSSWNKILTSNRVFRPTLFALAIATILGLISKQGFQTGYLAERYDLTPDVLNTIQVRYRPDRDATGVPDGSAAAQQLAQRIGLHFGPDEVLSQRSVLLFREDGTLFNVRMNGYTIDGLTADPASYQRVKGFLHKRNYRSALSWTATKHLYDLCLLHFDSTAALDVLLEDLSYGPHAQQVGQVVESMFFICAATPANVALLDKWADPSRFGYPDRPSIRLIGDLYRRFGAVDKALTWYRKADMPRSFLARIRAEKPLFHQGHVIGTLRLNGQPLADVQVGLVPWRLNGLPPVLEPPVAGSIKEILAVQPRNTLFSSFHPTPFAFRWISASTTTDAHGRFTLDGLTEGQYRFICTLPSQVNPTPPVDSGVSVENPPIPFAVHYGNPNVDLGIIDLTISPTVSQPHQAH